MKNSTKITISVILLYGALSFHSCAYLKELTALKDCEFRMGTLENPVLGGVDISKIFSVEDFSIEEAGKIAKRMLAGDLPLSFILNVEVKNPNPITASLNKLEYMTYIDDVMILEGAVENRVEISGFGGVSKIPLKIETDLMDFLKKDTRNALINFGLNLADAGNKPTRVSIKIKPYIRIGTQDFVYPGYISVKKEFASSQ